MSSPVVERIANGLGTVVLVIVAILVISAVFRLFLAHWTYIFLLLALVAGAFYVVWGVKNRY
jgi:hypothetical protein